MARRLVLSMLVTGLIGLFATPALAEDRAEGSLYLSDWTFVGGDGDGVPEPGERLKVFIGLSNTSELTYSDIRGTLSSLGHGVRVIEDSSTWPDLVGQDHAQSARAFVIEIPADAERQDVECRPFMADEPVSSDGNVGSVEPLVVEPDQGAAGSGAEPVEEPPSEAVSEPASKPAQEPASEPIEEPAPDEPRTDEDIEPAPTEVEDLPVRIEMTLSVTHSTGSADLIFDNGIVCAMLESGIGEDADLAPISAPGDGAVPTGSRATAIASASVLLGAMAAILGWLRFRRGTQIV